MKVYIKKKKKAGKRPDTSAREQILSEHVEGQRGTGSAPVKNGPWDPKGEGNAEIHPHEGCSGSTQGSGRRLWKANALLFSVGSQGWWKCHRPGHGGWMEHSSAWLPGRWGEAGSLSRKGPSKETFAFPKLL